MIEFKIKGTLVVEADSEEEAESTAFRNNYDLISIEDIEEL